MSGQGYAAEGAGPIYAHSVVGVLPAVSITWYQAQIACGNSGKELMPNAIWQMAASGADTNRVSNYGVMDMDGNVW